MGGAGRRLRRRPLRWLALLFAFVVAGCASGPQTVRGKFVSYPDAPGGSRPVWPPTPEIPRLRYAGELLGERNFVADAGTLSQGAKALRFIAGVEEAGDDQIPMELQRPVSGTVDPVTGRIYVTDMARKAVFVFDEREGQLELWDHLEGFGRFLAPVGVAMGRKGEVLVSDAELGEVFRFDQTGKVVGRFGKGIFKRPTGLAVDPEDGLVYVADTQDHNVKVFDYDGQMVRIVGNRGDAEDDRPAEYRFNYPTHIAFAGGQLYVTDALNARVCIFDSDGHPVRQFGKRGLYVGNFVQPKGVAVDGEGNIYVVESFYDHLLVFNGQGEFLMPVGGTGADAGRFFLPAGLWTDRHSRIFVADMYNGRVSIFQFLGGD